MIDISKGRYWDLPWSLVSSCTRCSPGCQNCWSLAMEKRFRKGIEGEIKIHPERLSIPLKRRKPTVYAVWNDIFHEEVPVNFLEDAIGVMTLCPQHTFLVLTKRAQRLNLMTQDRLRVALTDTWPIKNLWLGLTVCNPAEADEKIPRFLQVPGKKFLSIEPMLSSINFRWTPYHHQATGETYRQYLERKGSVNEYESLKQINTVILGGETLGNKPGREMKIEWAESVVDQCVSAGVPVFVKQIHVNGKVSKDMSEWPEDLRVRELPWVQS